MYIYVSREYNSPSRTNALGLPPLTANAFMKTRSVFAVNEKISVSAGHMGLKNGYLTLCNSFGVLP